MLNFNGSAKAYRLAKKVKEPKYQAKTFTGRYCKNQSRIEDEGTKDNPDEVSDYHKASENWDKSKPNTLSGYQGNFDISNNVYYN